MSLFIYGRDGGTHASDLPSPIAKPGTLLYPPRSREETSRRIRAAIEEADAMLKDVAARRPQVLWRSGEEITVAITESVYRLSQQRAGIMSRRDAETLFGVPRKPSVAVIAFYVFIVVVLVAIAIGWYYIATGMVPW